MPIKNYFRGSDYFNQPDELKNLSPEEVYKMIDEYKIIDVRTKFEYKRGHIKNAVNYKLGSERNIVDNFGTDAKIILICKTGHRSRAAANRLVRSGYKNMYHLQGGMNNWRRNKMPEEK